MTIDEEIRILDDLKQGITDDFSLIIEKYQRSVYSLVYKVVSNHEVAEEITQDVFVKCYSKINQLNRPEKFGGWLLRIAYHQSLNSRRGLRSSHRFKSLDSQLVDEVAVMVETNDLLEEKERHILLKSAISKLKAEEKMIVQLFYFDQKSIKEIAEITKLKESNIKVKLKRSRDLLLKFLNPIIKYYE